MSEPEAKPSRLPRVALRVLITLAALGLWWWIAKVSVAELAGAIARISALAFLAAIALTLCNLFVGAIRWRVLLAAYGARTAPSVMTLARVYLVGMFYNTFLPANVGGDVLRGYVTRGAFDGAAGGYLIVAIERAFGLAGLFLLAGAILYLHPIGDANATAAAGLALLVGVSAIAGPFVAQKLHRVLPGPLGDLARKLPKPVRPALFFFVLCCSLGTQSVVALTGHVLLASLTDIALAETFILVPVALIANYFPTIAGLGARETAFVVLLALVGVNEADATAGSLGMLAAVLVVALLGGLVHVTVGTGLETQDARDNDEPSGEG